MVVARPNMRGTASKSNMSVSDRAGGSRHGHQSAASLDHGIAEDCGVLAEWIVDIDIDRQDLRGIFSVFSLSCK